LQNNFFSARNRQNINTLQKQKPPHIPPAGNLLKKSHVSNLTSKV